MDDPKITATVARLMEAERATGLGGPYESLVTGLVSPVMLRVFALLYRNDKLPEPPDDLITGENPDTGQPNILLPQVTYENRLITALKAAENLAYAEWFEMIAGSVFSLAPEESVNMNWEHITRRTFGNTVGDPDGLRAKHEVTQLREEMARKALEEQEAAVAIEAAKVQR